MTNSFFIDNIAQTFFGGAISQEPCDPTFVPMNNVVNINSAPSANGPTGCSVIETVSLIILTYFSSRVLAPIMLARKCIFLTVSSIAIVALRASQSGFCFQPRCCLHQFVA